MFSCWGTEKSHREPGQASTVGVAAIHSAVHAIWLRKFQMNVLVRYRGETAPFS